MQAQSIILGVKCRFPDLYPSALSALSFPPPDHNVYYPSNSILTCTKYSGLPRRHKGSASFKTGNQNQSSKFPQCYVLSFVINILYIPYSIYGNNQIFQIKDSSVPCPCGPPKCISAASIPGRPD